MTLRISYSAIAAAALALLASGGCVHRSSGDLRLGGTVALPAIQSERQAAAQETESPALTSLDRANWPTTTIVAPVEVVSTLPGAATATPIAPDDDRRRGVYPTAVSAITLDDPSLERALLEGFLAPLRAAWDFATLPARYAGSGGGVAAYQRTPEGRPVMVVIGADAAGE